MKELGRRGDAQDMTRIRECPAGPSCDGLDTVPCGPAGNFGRMDLGGQTAMPLRRPGAPRAGARVFRICKLWATGLADASLLVFGWPTSLMSYGNERVTGNDTER